MSWHCARCGWDGDDPDSKEIREEHPYGDGYATEYLEILSCPACCSEDIDELDPIEPEPEEE